MYSSLFLILFAVRMTSMHVPLFVSQAAVVRKGESRGRGERLGVRGVRGWQRRGKEDRRGGGTFCW